MNTDWSTPVNDLVLLPPVPEVQLGAGQFVDALVCHVDEEKGASEFYVQPLIYKDILCALSKRLIEYYDIFHEPTEAGISQSVLQSCQGQVCAAKWTDGCWYRCRCLARQSPSTVLVHFLDHGNNDTIAIRDLRTLPQKLRQDRVPPLALKCTDAQADQINAKLFRQRVECENVVLEIASTNDNKSNEPPTTELVCNVWQVDVSDSRETCVSKELAQLSVAANK